jgi:hypothetical protein
MTRGNIYQLKSVIRMMLTRFITKPALSMSFNLMNPLVQFPFLYGQSDHEPTHE